MHTVKVLALRCSGHELHMVLNFLRGFPSLERLYVFVSTHFCLLIYMTELTSYLV
jgi:hypothetical protein